jgi:hypothetical protein
LYPKFQKQSHVSAGETSGYTPLGSGVWNTILISAGWWLDDRWKDVER